MRSRSLGFFAIILLAILAGSCRSPTEPLEGRDLLRGIDVERAISSSFTIAGPIFILDNVYLAYTKEEIEDRLWIGVGIRDIEYESEFSDCDDFAFLTKEWVRNPSIGLKGVAFGVINVRKPYNLKSHLINVFVDSDLEVWTSDLKREGIILERADPSFLVFWVII